MDLVEFGFNASLVGLAFTAMYHIAKFVIFFI